MRQSQKRCLHSTHSSGPHSGKHEPTNDAGLNFILSTMTKRNPARKVQAGSGGG